MVREVGLEVGAGIRMRTPRLCRWHVCMQRGAGAGADGGSHKALGVCSYASEHCHRLGQARRGKSGTSRDARTSNGGGEGERRDLWVHNNPHSHATKQHLLRHRR